MSSLVKIIDQTTDDVLSAPFRLHIHNDYEILLFLEGDAEYAIEENIYDLAPRDLIVIRKHQLHRIHHRSNSRYRRMILNVSPEFFEVNSCMEYQEHFIHPSNIGSKIDAKTVIDSGIYDAFMRLRKFYQNDENTPIVKALIIEILFLINNIKSYTKSETSSREKEIIAYINKNFMREISLEDLERRFFISKYHLCHIFPKITGLTVHQYITRKRLALAQELVKSGESLSEAAKHCGFNSYSSFYRAYLNEYGVSPKKK